MTVSDPEKELHQANSLNETGGYYNFSNIRYGQAPVGHLRWRAPRAPHSPGTNGSLMVTDGSIGRVCPQSSGNWTIVSQEFYPQYLTGQSFDYDAAEAALPTTPPAVSYDPRTTEDCLFLDVLAPKSAFDRNDTRLPVLVYIYGGGYSSGEKTGYGKFNPAGLFDISASGNHEPGFVWVAMNYRMGAFGFLANKNDNMTDITPNAGIYDQRLALQWVQENIHLFGGDNDRVTVMGASAGAGSIMHHITSNGGQGEGPYFKQAVLFSPAFLPAPTMDVPLETTRDFLSMLNVSSIAEARNLPSETLIATNARQIYSHAPYGSNLHGPYVDGDFVPALPGQALLNGSFHRDVKVMVSHNALEGLLFTSPQANTSAAYIGKLETSFPQISQTSLEMINNTLYPAIFDGNYVYTTEFQRAMATTQDSTIVCNPYYLASALEGQAYAIKFNVSPGIHGQETSYIFQNGVTSGVDTGVADSLQQYIASFVTNAVPSNNGTPLPVYGPDGQAMYLDTSGNVLSTDDSENARCKWWQQGLLD